MWFSFSSSPCGRKRLPLFVGSPFSLLKTPLVVPWADTLLLIFLPGFCRVCQRVADECECEAKKRKSGSLGGLCGLKNRTQASPLAGLAAKILIFLSLLFFFISRKTQKKETGKRRGCLWEEFLGPDAQTATLQRWQNNLKVLLHQGDRWHLCGLHTLNTKDTFNWTASRKTNTHWACNGKSHVKQVSDQGSPTWCPRTTWAGLFWK